MTGCAVPQSDVGWLNLVVVGAVLLAAVAVWLAFEHGLVLGLGRTDRGRWQWAYDLDGGGYLVISRLDTVERRKRWEVEHTRPVHGRLGDPSVHYYRHRWGALLHLHRAGGGREVREVTRARS